MEKVVISNAEVADAKPDAELPIRIEPMLASPIPWWARLALWPFITLLPLLCIFAIVLRVAIRGLPPRTRFAWTAFLATLLSTSGLITCAAFVLVISFAPAPSFISRNLVDLDERTSFVQLPTAAAMSAKEASENLKPLVAVISPERRSWFGGQDLPSGTIGAGSLLSANTAGYLLITARHVLDASYPTRDKTPRALLAMASGTWCSGEVVAQHKYLDLSLLWVPRSSGHAEFVQPLAARKDVSEGENISVIGHPEGLRFTLSTGVISRVSGDIVQLTAPVSPGNSGGPVFDDHGNLVAIVTSMVDKHMDPNAENLNFAVLADALRRATDWDYFGGGQHYMTDFLDHSREMRQEAKSIHESAQGQK